MILKMNIVIDNFKLDEKKYTFEFDTLKSITDEDLEHNERLTVMKSKKDRYSNILPCNL